MQFYSEAIVFFQDASACDVLTEASVQQARIIFDLYVREGSERQINLPARVQKACMCALEEAPTKEMFQDCVREARMPLDSAVPLLAGRTTTLATST